MVDLFIEARLLLRDRRPFEGTDADIVEVTHEALLREWAALRAWLDADRQFLIGKDQLADIANWRDAESRAEGRSATSTGLNLTRSRQWLIERQPQDFNTGEREFIAASIRRAEATARRRRWVGLGAACVLLLITCAAVWKSIQAERGRRAAAEARKRAESRLGLARRSAEDLVN